jgi:hypothetical protein
MRLALSTCGRRRKEIERPCVIGSVTGHAAGFGRDTRVNAPNAEYDQRRDERYADPNHDVRIEFFGRAPRQIVRLRTDASADLEHALAMDWIAATAEWGHFKHQVRARWTKLTAAELDAIGGERVRLEEQISSSYGVTAEEAERQICHFEARNEYFSAVSSR